jgi:hypothetical protein
MLRTRLLLLPALAVSALALPATAGAAFQVHITRPTTVGFTGTDDPGHLVVGIDAQGRCTTRPRPASPRRWTSTARSRARGP